MTVAGAAHDHSIPNSASISGTTGSGGSASTGNSTAVNTGDSAAANTGNPTTLPNVSSSGPSIDRLQKTLAVKLAIKW